MISFDDGVVYREESKEMAERIASGKLMEADTGAAPAAPAAELEDQAGS